MHSFLAQVMTQDARGLFVIQLIAFWPVWRWYAGRMLDGSDEPWGIVALITAFVLLILQPRKQVRTEPWMLCGILGISLLYITFYASLPALLKGAIAMLSLLLTLRCLGLSQGVFLGVGGLLLLSLPVIASLQFYLGYPLRMVTSHIAAEILSFCSIPVEAQGTLLHWRGEVLSVDAPCSGVKMLWTSLYLCFSVSCFLQMGSFFTWLSYSFTCMVVFFGNLLRTVLVFCLEMRIIELPFDAHMLTGMIVFMLVSSVVLFFQLFVVRRFLCAPS